MADTINITDYTVVEWVYTFACVWCSRPVRIKTKESPQKATDVDVTCHHCGRQYKITCGAEDDNPEFNDVPIQE